jgi:hypothetical protein
MNLHEHCAAQYHASLAMLDQAIDKCPESLWTAPEYRNQYWHIAYHTVFYTHFYLHPGEADFRPWPKHKPDYQYLGSRPWAPEEKPIAREAFSRADLLEYLEFCRTAITARVPGLDLDAPSGFSWLPFNKLELQL